MLTTEEKKIINKGIEVIKKAIKRGDKADVMSMLMPLAAAMDDSDGNVIASPELDLEGPSSVKKKVGYIKDDDGDDDYYFSEQYIPSLSSRGLQELA